MRPAAHLLSFASPKESRQRKGDPTCRVPSLRCGQPAPRRCRGALQNSLRASRCAQTAAASQMTKQLLPHAAQLPPRQRRVAGASRTDGTERAIASLGPAHTARSARALGAERSDGPCGFPTPLWTCREAQWSECARAAQHARASCSDSPRLFERSAQREVSSAAAPRPRASQVARSAAKGHGKWGRLSLPTFFGEAKKVGRPPGRNPGQQRN